MEVGGRVDVQDYRVSSAGLRPLLSSGASPGPSTEDRRANDNDNESTFRQQEVMEWEQRVRRDCITNGMTVQHKRQSDEGDEDKEQTLPETQELASDSDSAVVTLASDPDSAGETQPGPSDWKFTFVATNIRFRTVNQALMKRQKRPRVA